MSYALMQPSRQPLMGRSWRARCDRRRVLPPECQRRHQLGASGDRASPPHRSRSHRHRSGYATGRTACRKGSRRNPRAPCAVANVPEDHVAAARRATAADGRRPARIRSGRRASGVAGPARLRRTARRAVPRHPDRRRIPNRRSGFRGELRHRRRIACCLGVDPSPAQAGRPHAGAVHVGDGKPCCTSYPASAQVGAGRRHHGLRAVGTRRRTAATLVAGRQAGRRVRRPARAGETRGAARCAGAARRPSAGHRRRRRRPRQAQKRHAVSRFHRCALRRTARDGIRQHGRLRPPRRTRDVLPGRAGSDGVRPAGHRTKRGRTARPRGALPHRVATGGRRIRSEARRIRRPPDRRTAALLARRTSQRARAGRGPRSATS